MYNAFNGVAVIRMICDARVNIKYKIYQIANSSTQISNTFNKYLEYPLLDNDESPQ